MFWIILGIIVIALICAGSISRANEEDRRMAAAKNNTCTASTAKTQASGRNFYTGNYNNTYNNDAALQASMRFNQECLDNLNRMQQEQFRRFNQECLDNANRLQREEFTRFMDPCDSYCGYSYFNDPCNNGFGGGFGF